MEERNENDKMDEIMLPGFRFHPTDEEIVGFYLRRKIQQRPPTVELIKQLDIYKYDPWDLPKLAATGEKEWYFYCPRDRKYRNSARPNRVTGAGFWKATGTDRPIYSSDDSKCIGLKKSLVFYKGRAAKGVKTDWMMHEFRLPSLTDSSPSRRYIDKNIPASDSWAICRIFKKTNSAAYRALSNSWVSPMPETTAQSHNVRNEQYNPHFDSSLSLSAKTSSNIPPYCFSQYLQQSCTASISPIDFTLYKHLNPSPIKASQLPVSAINNPTSFMFSPLEASSGPAKSTVEMPSMFSNSVMAGDSGKGSELDFGGTQEKWNGFSYDLPQGVHGNNNLDDNSHANETETLGNIGMPLNMGDNAWKPHMVWDSSSCPSEMSSSFSSTKCYT